MADTSRTNKLAAFKHKSGRVTRLTPAVLCARKATVSGKLRHTITSTNRRMDQESPTTGVTNVKDSAIGVDSEILHEMYHHRRIRAFGCFPYNLLILGQ